MLTKIKCANDDCNDMFLPLHGNRKYCSPGCHLQHKKKRQNKIYRVIKIARKGLLNNYWLFCKLLTVKGVKKIPVESLQLEKFDQNGFYGSYKDENNNQWFRVEEYSFSFTSEDKSLFLNIKK